MSIDPAELDALYKRYGFNALSTGVSGVRGYALRTGYFLNADVVAIATGAELLEAKRQLEETGYACSVRSFASLADAETQLFEGFFAAESSRERLMQEYQRFSQKVTRTLGNEYEYIAGPFNTAGFSPVPNENVVQCLLRLLRTPGPTLVILEAAAGFGKSCTAYEVLNQMLLMTGGQVPLLTELSLNRQAKIFRYVLLDEIDRNFPSLRSELVREQIQAGRMPLIVDGFDELLSRTGATTDHFEEAEPMLDTISVLLKDQAKILITTRRTAIFSGDEFAQWLANRPAQFAVYRVRLSGPSLEDWLGTERVKQLSLNNESIHELANPVLLSFLRSVSKAEFAHLCEMPGEIVSRYFESLLEREKERQDLLLTVPEQLRVFRQLACDMAKEHFTAEDREYLQLRIGDANQSLLERARLEYRKDERPTVDELASRLAGHALLDRRGTNDSQIGFVNDFILGSLLGNAITDGMLDSTSISDFETFVDLAVTAFAAEAPARQRLLWEKLTEIIPLFDPKRQMEIDLVLTAQPQRNFKEASFSGLRVRNSCVGSDNYIDNCLFINCTFNNVEIVCTLLQDVTFINCSFFAVRVSGNPRTQRTLRLIACDGDEESLGQIRKMESQAPEEPKETNMERQFETAVLENFWPKGRAQYARAKNINTLFRGHAPGQHEQIEEAVERLRKRGLISFDSDQAVLNLERRNEILQLLGRHEQ